MFKPMLAADADPALLRFPLMASPKLDGIRASVVNGKLLTRSLKEVPNRHLFHSLSLDALDGLDGELIVDSPMAPDVYRKTVSGVMSHEGISGAAFHVFDLHNRNAPYHERLQELREFKWPAGLQVSVSILPQAHIQDEQQLTTYEAALVSCGYEGVILRDAEAPYKFGRSTAKEGYLLKLKRFQDSEAEVLEVIEEMFNANDAQTNELGRTQRSTAKANLVPKGRMGALRVRDVTTGVEFNIGTGFNDADKSDWWTNHRARIGAVVKYKFFPVGVKDKPRHPVFLGLRSKRDL